MSAAPGSEPKMYTDNINRVMSPNQDGDTKVIELNYADPALQFLGGEVVEYTPEEARAVLRKIDWALMPMLCWVYALQFADKTSLNYASLMGIREDTHLDPTSQQFSWASSIFYAGYIAWEYVWPWTSAAVLASTSPYHGQACLANSPLQVPHDLPSPPPAARQVLFHQHRHLGWCPALPLCRQQLCRTSFRQVLPRCL